MQEANSRFLLKLKEMNMPRMVYGTAWKKENTKNLVEMALTKGFRGIDTAGQQLHYNQKGAGEGIHQWLQKNPTFSRDDIFIQTKYSPGQNNGDAYDPKVSLYEQVLQSANKSLKDLNTQFIDSYLLHSPVPTIEGILEIWSAFEDLVSQKKVRFIGLSNFYQPELVEFLYSTAKIKPSVIQNRFYGDSGYDKNIREFCNVHNIIYQSFWTLTANPHIIKGIEKTFKQNGINCLYKFTLQNQIVPLNGTTSQQHMEDDLNLLDSSALDKEITDYIFSQIGS